MCDVWDIQLVTEDRNFLMPNRMLSTCHTLRSQLCRDVKYYQEIGQEESIMESVAGRTKVACPTPHGRSRAAAAEAGSWCCSNRETEPLSLGLNGIMT